MSACAASRLIGGDIDDAGLAPAVECGDEGARVMELCTIRILGRRRLRHRRCRRRLQGTAAAGEVARRACGPHQGGSRRGPASARRRAEDPRRVSAQAARRTEGRRADRRPRKSEAERIAGRRRSILSGARAPHAPGGREDRAGTGQGLASAQRCRRYRHRSARKIIAQSLDARSGGAMIDAAIAALPQQLH